ncbi:shikimate kinase [Mesorhizobium caraganae]|uniref:shikimate kinase n=1 Tax=Mesorhizobium caraganae TaxID=483206 RepID=UPI001939D331|nr:shikimate kinase [Mesorhizobium caraganae]MBM2715377.1 shikimate kinase [Mesorhizobium caraganae]
MTGIGRSRKSRVGNAGADSTWGSSSLRPESSLALAEGSQSFDSVVERMRSGPQDRGSSSAQTAPGADDALGDRFSGLSVGPQRLLDPAIRAAAAPRAGTARRRGFPSMSEGEATAPVASPPPTSGVAGAISLSGEEINATKRQMDGLLEGLDACRNAALQAQNSEEAQELIDRLVNAGSTVLDYYASLPPAVARSILSDDRARGLRDEALDAANQCNELATATLYNLEGRRKSATAVLNGMQSKATPDQLSRVASSVAKHYVACTQWWEKKARRCERMRSVCAATANLPSATAEMRQDEEAALRLHTGWALNTKVMQLQSRVALAQVKIEPHASTFEAPVREILMGENGQVRLLGTFIGDVFPAFNSTSDAVLNSKGRPLDAEHCAVLEGVMERLSGFASAMHDILAKLSDDRTGLPLELLGQIVEGAWITADEVMHLLALQPKPQATIAPPADASAAMPADTAGKAAVAEGTATRSRKGKGKSKPAAGAGSSATGRPEPQVAAGVGDTAPAAKVLVRPDLGKKLVSAKEAHASAAAAADLAICQAPPSMGVLTPRLERLDELLQFDLAGQQRTVSQARQMKPEDADHTVDTVVKRLQTQATEMQACLAALEEPRRRVLLTPAQVIEVDDKTARLKVLLSEAQKLAKAVNSEPSLVPGKGSQSFDSVVERMHSGPQETSSAHIARGADDALGDKSSGPSLGTHRILGAAPGEVTAPRRGFPSVPKGGPPAREETSLGSDGKPWLGHQGPRSSQPDTLLPHRQPESDPGAGPGRRRFDQVAAQSFNEAYSENLINNALHDISFARDITRFSCAVVEYDRKLQGRAHHATFLQRAASEFKREFVPRWEQDIRARNTWGYATSCNAMSREPGGQAGMEACRAMAAQVSRLGNALNDVESKTLSLFVLSFSRYPRVAECRNGMIRIAKFFRERRGALSELNSQSLALLVNGFSKWPQQENSREATIAVAAEIRRRPPGLSDFGPQNLANVVNGLSKWPEEAECRGAIRAIASEIRHRADRRDVWLSDFGPQNLATVVNGLSKWPEEAECRGAIKAIASEVRHRAGRRDVWLSDFDPQALANLVNGFSKWPQDCRDAIVAIADEVHHRAGRRDVWLSGFDPQALANLVNGFSKWPQDCRDAIVAIADEVHHRGDRLSSFTPQHLANLVNGFSRWPEGAKCNDAILAIAGEVRRRAGRADRLSSFTPQHLSSLVNGFSRWPERTDGHSVIVEIADEVRRRADRLSGFDPQALANLVNGFSKWPDETRCGDATLAIAGELCRRADRLSGFDPQGLANLVNGFSKWPDETRCGDATLAIAGELCRRADRLSGFDPQALANLVNGFSKWPQEQNSRHATAVIAGEVLHRADRLPDFTSQHLANLVNGFSKWPREENSRQATVVIADEVLRADRLSDFTPQGLASMVNGFSKWLQEQDTRQATVAIANEVSRRDNRLSDFTPQGLANLMNGFSKWPEEAACHGAIIDMAGKLGSGDVRFGAFTTTQLSMIANALGRGVTRGEGTGEIIETALLKNRLHDLAHYLHYASDRLEQAQVLNIAMFFKALAKAQLFDDLGLLARTGLDRLTELHHTPGFAAENNLEIMGNLCVALLPLARSPRKDLRWHRRQALNLLNDIQPIIEHKIEGHLKAGDAERTRGPCSSRCPALSIYQTLKARAVLATMFRRPYVEGKKSDLRVRQEELQFKTKEILDKTGGLVEGDLSNMSWNLIAEIAAETPVDALDTFVAQNAATVQAQHPASVFDVHQVLRAMDHEPRPPQGEAGLMQLQVVDMQGRPVATEPETRYSIFHRLTSGVLPVVAVQLPGKPSAFMLARTVTVEGVPYRMDLFGGSKLKPPKKPVSQVAARVPGMVGAESSGGKLLAIPYAETAPGTAFEQLSRAWAPFKEAYYYTQRRGFAAPPAIKGLGVHDYALEGTFKLSLLPDRPANQEHPFKLTGPEGPIALRPHDGCGFIKASLANRMTAVRRAGRQEGPDRMPAFAEGRRTSVPASALQHYPRSEPVADEAHEKAKTWLESRQGRGLTSEELFRTVTAGHIDGPGAVAVPSSDECLHVPTLKSDTLGTSGVLVGRSPYDKPNLRPFAAQRVKAAVDGDPTAVFLDNCTAIQYSFNVAQKSGEELASDDPAFFAKGILIVVPDKMWPAAYADRGLVMSAEDVKCHSSWTSSKDRVKVDTPLDCLGILQATEVFAPGSLVAVPTGEQKKLDGDFDGDTVVIVGDRPQLYEHVRQFDHKEQALGRPSLKPPKSHTPALEGDNYQFGRARQILAATQDVLETYSCLQRNFLAQSHEAQRWFAERAVFGTYEGVHHELRREIRQLLGQEEVSSQEIQNTFAKARHEIEVAKHPVAREMAELLLADLAAWAMKPNEQLRPETIESANAANPTLSARLCELFADLVETYPATPQPRDRIQVLLDHYPPRIDPRPDGYNPDDLVQSATNLLSLGIKVGTDAYKSDTGANLFFKKSQNLQRLLHATPGLKSVPYVKGVAATLAQGRFDVDATLEDLRDNPTLAASIMETSIKLAAERGILPKPSGLRPAAEDADMITLTREEASERAQNEADRARAEETKITEAALGVAASLGKTDIQVKMPHLDHRLKSHASMTDQFTGMSIPPGSAPQLISNAVRHVFEVSDKDFTRAFKKAMLAFEERGYAERQTTNWFRMRSPTFIGIKTVLTTPEAYRFEVEFHTPSSYRAKLANHDTYKILDRLRRQASGDALEQAKAEELVQRTREVCTEIEIPDDVLSIAHWGAEGDRRGGASAAFGLRAVEQSRMPEIARSPEAREIVEALDVRPIVLVGMPGAGKSTIGSAIAKRLGLRFIDTDQKIKKEAGKSISQIFVDHGENHFRELEAKVIARVLEQGPAVIATGGGSFMHKQTRRLVGEKAVSLWLDTSLDIVQRRLRNDTNRPLLQGPNPDQEITQLMSERKPLYTQADVTVVPPHEKDKKNVDPCVEALHVYLRGEATADRSTANVVGMAE